MDPAQHQRPPSFTGMRTADPKVIGPFKILKRIGEGGMGIVFLAQQEHPTRTVALKVIHAGALSPRTLRRFEHEGEMLARLQHPGIAQIYQAGTYETDQGVLPYFAMEYVEGARLDVYAGRHKLSTRARLELAARITDAIEHAHQKGVIHRDVKPGNILVTEEGQPKILDFGVGRLDDDESRTTTLRTDLGSVLGTLPYMSPEQASGDPSAIDARADVYSLGVVLYELLTGKLPYSLERSALPEAVRIIQEEEPSKLSTHDRALRGDVETIVQKALEKDRTRRYPSAQALGDDIRRHLTDEPIQARPPSSWYQFSKFARRNKVLVSGIAAVLGTLAVGVGVSTRLWLQEREASGRERVAREQAEQNERQARAATTFLESLFAGIDPSYALGADTTLLERILGDARARLGELTDHPEAEARIRLTLGRAYLSLTRFDEADAELGRAAELMTEIHGPDDRRTLEARRMLAATLLRRGELEEAEAAQRELIAKQEQALGADDLSTLNTRQDLGSGLMRQGRYREAEELLRSVVASLEAQFGTDDEDTHEARIVLAQTLNYQAKNEEARQLLETVFEHRLAKNGPDDPGTLIAQGTLASALDDLGRLEQAEVLGRDAFERARRVWSLDNQQTLSIQNNLAWVLGRMGKHVEGEAMLRDCLERRARVFGVEHAETLNTRINLVGFLLSLGRRDEADAMIPELVATTRRVLGEDHKETMRAHYYAGMMYGAQKRWREAADSFIPLVERDRKVKRADDPSLSLSLYNLGATLQNADDNPAAEPYLREAIRLVEDNDLEREEFVPAARNALAKVLEERGEHEQADALFQDALEDRRRRYPGASAELAYSLNDYGDALLERGDAEAAEPLLAELVEMQEKLRGGNDPELAEARLLHGRALAKLGSYVDAETLLVRAAETFARSSGLPAATAHAARTALLELYAAWDAAEPGQDIAARAERWRTKLPSEE